MIKRIVKLTFQLEKVADFLQVFEESKAAIRGFEGCLHVELLQDVLLPNRFFTFSLWESEAALNLYRKSPLFEATWARTKVLFSEKAEAWTVVVAAE
jgi:quinol monooxygenase YgiN